MFDVEGLSVCAYVVVVAVVDSRVIRIKRLWGPL